MNRCVTSLAIFAICVSGALSNPQEADPINIEYDDGYDVPIDCEWGDWGACSATCGMGRQVCNVMSHFLIANHITRQSGGVFCNFI